MSAFRSFVVPSVLVCLAGCAPDRLVRPDAAPSAASVTPSLARGSGSSGTSGSGGPQFLQPEAGAATIANPIVRFWAKRGVDARAEMYYHRAHGGRDSIPFFSLRIRQRSLWKRPNGALFADGDSVLITLTLVDAQKGIVDCQPAGLLFSPTEPARLRMSFIEADDDLNHDGSVNATDAVITRLLAVWRKETPNDPWLRMSSVVSGGSRDVDTDLGGFTGYAIAW